MTFETRITDALTAEVDGLTPTGDLAATAIRAGRRTRRLRAVGSSAALALVVAAGAVLAAQDDGRRDSLTTPASQLPSAAPTPSPTPSLSEEQQQAMQMAQDEVRRRMDARAALWLSQLPLGAKPQVAWTYRLGFHSPTLNHSFPSGGWLVPLGHGGGGYVIELHSEGDTGAGDAEKQTGVLTAAGFRVIDHGDLTHGLSADGRLLASSLWEAGPSDAPTGFNIYVTATGRRRAHVNYPFLASRVISVSANSVKMRVLRDTDVEEQLVLWDLASGKVRDLGPAPRNSTVDNQVVERPFTFVDGTLRELDGKRRALGLQNPVPVGVHDAVHESDDAVLVVVGGQETGDLALLRCRFSTQSCERATSLGADRKGDFALDASLR